ncbi:hypothetical protein COP2_043427 [Malus domestica]
MVSIRNPNFIPVIPSNSKDENDVNVCSRCNCVAISAAFKPLLDKARVPDEDQRKGKMVVSRSRVGWQHIKMGTREMLGEF